MIDAAVTEKLLKSAAVLKSGFESLKAGMAEMDSDKIRVSSASIQTSIADFSRLVLSSSVLKLTTREDPVRKELRKTMAEIRDLARSNKKIAENSLGFINDFFRIIATAVTDAVDNKAKAKGKAVSIFVDRIA